MSDSQTSANTMASSRYRDIPFTKSATEVLRQPTTVEVRAGEESPAWLEPVIDRLNTLVRLEDGWNSYGGQHVELTTCRAALDLLQLNRWRGLVPSISPVPDGGLLLEWERNDQGLELWIEPSGVVTAVVDSAEGVSEYVGLSTTGAGVHQLLENIRHW